MLRLPDAFAPPPSHRATPEAALLDWYMTTFVPAPERGFALMNPVSADHDYLTKTESLTQAHIARALNDEVRMLTIARRTTKVPLSYAVSTATATGWAQALTIAMMHSGRAAVTAVLRQCAAQHMFAFAQLHQDGGQVYIVMEARQPAILLESIARQIQVATGVGSAIVAAMPLPLMPNLRASGGPQRSPILLPSGAVIDATNPWQALAELRDQCQPNTTEALLAAFQRLPAVSVRQPSKLHASKVNPRKDGSVIAWFNHHHTLETVLAEAGLTEQGCLVHCPFHDDSHPTLAIWQHGDGNMVCHCLSAQPDCPAAASPYLDAFTLMCLIAKRSPQAVIIDLIARHRLGQQRTLQVIACQPPRDPRAAWPEHQQALTAARRQLEQGMQDATHARGQVTVLGDTPGIGKTYLGAKLANAASRQGKRVAIVVGSHAIATSEWEPLLDRPMIWKSRLTLCADTCCPKVLLETLPMLGYALPPCASGCRYLAQADQRAGHIVIYQYHHLHFDGGALLADTDLIIVDESPLQALIAEQTATRMELQELLTHLEGQRDPTAQIVQALAALTRGTKTLSGAEIVRAVEARLEGPLNTILARAAKAKAAWRHPAPNPKVNLEKLPRLFLGDLLAALTHDAQHPNSLLSLAHGAYQWYEKRPFLPDPYAHDRPPAVIVLDGSANPMVSAALYQPWPVAVVAIDTPISPYVTLVQCSVTPATRQIVQEPERLKALARAIAAVCNHFEVVLAGGVTYKGAISILAESLGGAWLYYGNQRGKNHLATVPAMACVASPTLPPDVPLRMAQAIWSNDATPIMSVPTRLAAGAYGDADARVQAVTNLLGREELRQAAHRSRMILREEPVIVLIFSPWDLTAIGLAPHITITDVPYGNSRESYQALEQYQERMTLQVAGGQGSSLPG